MFGISVQKLSGIPLTVVGDGSQTRDFTFVSDVVRAVWPPPEVMSQEKYSMLALVFQCL